MLVHHIPVLLNEVLKLFEAKKILNFWDGTCGAGGHSEAILKSHAEIQHLFATDQDITALELAKERLQQFPVTFLHGNFSELVEDSLPKVMHKMGIEGFDGLLFDLGVSSMQLDQAGRGFSFMRSGPLDMRMDQSQDMTAADIIRSTQERALADIFYELGDETRSRKIAKAICEARKKKPIQTTEELALIVAEAVGAGGKRSYAIHPATKVFQALRIKVNEELFVLEKLLGNVSSVVAPGGVLAVITFHSLEDRIVKHMFREMERSGGWQILTKKPIEPTYRETKENPRSRSAKVRGIKKNDSVDQEGKIHD